MRLVRFIAVGLLVGAAALLLRSRTAEIDITETASRVEKLRGLEFSELPGAEWVSQETASEGVAAPPGVERAMLSLLGLEAGVEPESGIYGAYDPSDGRVEVVRGMPEPLSELILVHELAHALDDQHFGQADTSEVSDDEALAAQALVEGAASLVERDYADRHLDGDRSSLSWGRPTGFHDRDGQLVYERGLRFAAALRAINGWVTVDQALKLQPPRSTEQVLHPQKWLDEEEPAEVFLPRVALGDGWRRVDVGTWGEWRTGALVGERLATGWGGDRFELWRRGTDHVLVMRWTWDTRAGARALADGLRRRSFARGARIWAEGATVTLVLAPSGALAARVS